MKEKEDVPTIDPLLWGNLPRELRVIVYEHLREAIAKCRKDASFLTVLHNFATQTAGGVSPACEAQEAVGEAFELALDELMGLDDEICETCGEFHGEGTEHAPKNPKDFS